MAGYEYDKDRFSDKVASALAYSLVGFGWVFGTALLIGAIYLLLILVKYLLH